MKKITSILVLVFAFTLATQAQRTRKQQGPQLTTAQQVDLTVKKMTLDLDLTATQQREIKPLITSKIADRKATMEKRKANTDDKKKLTSDEIYAIKSKQLDNQISLKNILSKEQFEKFEKMQKRKKMKGKKMMKSRKGRKVQREKK